MTQIDYLTYLKYDEYSTIYMINIENLNNYVVTIKSSPDNDVLIENWLEQHCYLVLMTHSVDDFTRKVNRNLQIAKHSNDTEYMTYLSEKLKIEVDRTNWEYVPNKIKIKIKIRVKSVKSKEGFAISEQLAGVINVPIDMIFRYKSGVIKLIHKYIYDNQLQNRFDRNTITPDESLSSILIPLDKNEREYTYDNLPLHINGIKHLT